MIVMNTTITKLKKKPNYSTRVYFQKNGYSCGVIAALNCLKRTNFKVSYSSYYGFIKKEISCRQVGCSRTKFLQFMKKYYVYKGKLRYPDVERLKKYKNCIFVLDILTFTSAFDGTYHYVCMEMDNNSIKIYNIYDKRKKRLVNEKLTKKQFEKKYCYNPENNTEVMVFGERKKINV